MTNADMNPDLSIVIPIYNEEGLVVNAVDELVADLADQLPGFTYELILTENGSTDNTRELSQGLEQRYDQVRVLHSPEPNYGRALRRGILEARGTWVICDEIDICDLDFYQRALKVLKTEGADLVVGSKAHRDAQDERPFSRRLGTQVINSLLRVCVGFKGTDTHGLKSFIREPLIPVVNRCVVDKDLFASEFVIRAQRDNLRVLEIPIVIHEKRPPSIHLYRRVPHVLKNLARLTYAIRIKSRR